MAKSKKAAEKTPPDPETPLLPIGHPMRQKVESLRDEVFHAALDGGDPRLLELARRLRAAVESKQERNPIRKGQTPKAARRLVQAVAYDIERFGGEPVRTAEAFVKKVSVSAFRYEVDSICSPFAALDADYLGVDPDASEDEAERYYEAVERVAKVFRKRCPDFEESEGRLSPTEAKAATRDGLIALGMHEKRVWNHFGKRLVLK